MSTTPPGPGWWQASDGNWYAPEQHPAAVAQQATPAADPNAEVTGFTTEVSAPSAAAAASSSGGIPVWALVAGIVAFVAIIGSLAFALTRGGSTSVPGLPGLASGGDPCRVSDEAIGKAGNFVVEKADRSSGGCSFSGKNNRKMSTGDQTVSVSITAYPDAAKGAERLQKERNSENKGAPGSAVGVWDEVIPGDDPVGRALGATMFLRKGDRVFLVQLKNQVQPSSVVANIGDELGKSL